MQCPFPLYSPVSLFDSVDNEGLRRMASFCFSPPGLEKGSIAFFFFYLTKKCSPPETSSLALSLSPLPQCLQAFIWSPETSSFLTLFLFLPCLQLWTVFSTSPAICFPGPLASHSPLGLVSCGLYWTRRRVGQGIVGRLAGGRGGLQRVDGAGTKSSVARLQLIRSTFSE